MKTRILLFAFLWVASVAYGQNATELVQALEQIVQTEEVVLLSEQFELSEPFSIAGLLDLREAVSAMPLEDKLRIVDMEEVFFQKLPHFRFAELNQQDKSIRASFTVAGSDFDPEKGVSVTMTLMRGNEGWEVMAFKQGQ